MAFELAGRNLRPRDVGDLRKSIAQSEEGASAGKFADFFNGHLAFSRRVWALSENRYLREALERLVVPLFALYLPRVSFKCDGLMQKALRCSGRQQQILEAMQTGDVREIKRMVSDCLIQMKRIISQL